MRISGFVASAVVAVALIVAVVQHDAVTPPKVLSPAAAAPTLAIEAQPAFITPSSDPRDLSKYHLDGVPSRRNGAYADLPQELHTPPRASPFEQPFIQRMANMYQLDQSDADLFSPTGRSMLCGAASMANALLYLRVNRVPPIDDIAKTSMSPDGSKDDLLRMVFGRCHVSRAKGSTDRQLLDCASDFLDEGGYSRQSTWLHTMWAEIGSVHRVAPQPADLRETIQYNRVAVLLFGWYIANRNPVTGVWAYVRTGGHFVTLSGYDRADDDRVYITNPLIDYDALGVAPVSALVLERVDPDIAFARLSEAPADNLNTVRGTKWQTRDLTFRRIAVLESILVVGPTPRSGGPSVLR